MSGQVGNLEATLRSTARARLIAFCVSALLASSASLAHAGPVERISQIESPAPDSDQLVLRYENGGNGLLLSDDLGKSAKLLCGTVIGTVAEDTNLLDVLPDGHLLWALFDHVLESSDQGCTWSPVASLAHQRLLSFVPDPSDASAVFAVTTAGGKANGIIRRSADGSWHDIGKKESVLIPSLRVVQNGKALRFYESIARGEKQDADSGRSEAVYFLRWSDDGGNSWHETPFPLFLGNLQIVAVDPNDPKRIVVAVDRDVGNDELMLSSDSGEHVEHYLDVGQVAGVTSAPDGRFWFSDASTINDKAGVFFARSLDVPPVRLPDSQYNAFVLHYQAKSDAVYASRLLDFGTIDQSSGAFQRLFHFADVPAYASCPGIDMADACELQVCGAWCGMGHFCGAPFCEVYDSYACGPCADGDALPACIAWHARKHDAGVMKMPDAGATHTVGKDDGCGCGVLGARRERGGLGAWLGVCALAGMLLTRRVPRAARTRSRRNQHARS